MGWQRESVPQSVMPIASDVVAEIESQLGKSGVLSQPSDLKLYEYDGGVDKSLPDVVVFPRTTEDVIALTKLARRHNLAIVGRGAGRELSGGALARAGGMTI